jgi:hypothetical protein
VADAVSTIFVPCVLSAIPVPSIVGYLGCCSGY